MSNQSITPRAASYTNSGTLPSFSTVGSFTYTTSGTNFQVGGAALSALVANPASIRGGMFLYSSARNQVRRISNFDPNTGQGTLKEAFSSDVLVAESVKVVSSSYTSLGISFASANGILDGVIMPANLVFNWTLNGSSVAPIAYNATGNTMTVIYSELTA